MNIKNLIVGIFIMALSFQSQATDDCASDMAELKVLSGIDFPNSWIEVGATDSKPMNLNITEENDKLQIVFEKARSGVWGSGDIEVCKKGRNFEIVSISIQPGAAAPGLIKNQMKPGAKFKLEVKSSTAVRVSAGLLWSGNFEEKD